MKAKRTKGKPRKFHRAFLDLEPQDYCILEAAAQTSIKRFGLQGRWPVEDLVDFGWERVFFYCRTHEQFKRYGFLHCITEMSKRLKGWRWPSRNTISLDEIGPENIETEYPQGEFL